MKRIGSAAAALALLLSTTALAQTDPATVPESPALPSATGEQQPDMQLPLPDLSTGMPESPEMPPDPMAAPVPAIPGDFDYGGEGIAMDPAGGMGPDAMNPAMGHGDMGDMIGPGGTMGQGEQPGGHGYQHGPQHHAEHHRMRNRGERHRSPGAVFRFKGGEGGPSITIKCADRDTTEECARAVLPLIERALPANGPAAIQ